MGTTQPTITDQQHLVARSKSVAQPLVHSDARQDHPQPIVKEQREVVRRIVRPRPPRQPFVLRT
jgi:hypothetical protein